jgi:hypothetical protein
VASDVARYPSRCKIKICYQRWILTCMFSLFSRLMLNMFTDVFFIIAKRGPLRDEDCYWDYGKARCSWPEYCEYRFFLSLQILFLITILIYIYFLKLFVFYLINGERRYLFGDVHLGQSCRLKNSSADALLNYL